MATKLWVGGSGVGAAQTSWATVDNWSPAGVPVAGDDVVLRDSAIAIDGGLDQSAVKLHSLTVEQSYTGLVGTTSAYLVVGFEHLSIGQNSGADASAQGSRRLKISQSSVGAPYASDIEVWDSADAGQEANRPPVQLLAANASCNLDVLRGIVGVAVGSPTETSTLGIVQVNYRESEANDAECTLGAGVTITTLKTRAGKTRLLGSIAFDRVTASGGSLEIDGGPTITQLDNRGAEIQLMGDVHVATLNQYAGTLVPNGAVTLDAVVQAGGTMDFSRSSKTCTVGDLTLNAGTFKQVPGRITITGAVVLGGSAASVS